MRTALRCIALSLATLCCDSFAQAPAGYPRDYGQTLAAARKEGKVVVYSVLSNKAAQPLLNDFNALYPDIKVEYDGEMGSSEMQERFLSEAAAGRDTADVAWSSAMDLQLKLVEDGHARAYESPEAKGLPSWALYRDQAYGTTYEPVVFIYNKERVAAEDIPRDHASFAIRPAA